MRIKYRLVFFILLLITPVIIFGCNTEEINFPMSNRVIKGIVKDSLNSNPIDNVLITTTPPSSDVVSDSLGNFFLTGIKEGDYFITFRKLGYNIKTLSINISSDTLDLGTIKLSHANATHVLYGIVKDSISSFALKDVLITTIPSSSNGITDSSGNFIITGLEEGNYVLTFNKVGYYQRIMSVIVTSDTTNLGTIMLYFINIWKFNGLVVNEYFNNNSYSAVNLYLGQVVQETNNANKDIQLRDSAGMSVNFIFRSADLATRFAGNQTKISNPQINPRTQTEEFTKADFDTLSKIQTISPNISEADFPNDRTLSFNAPLQGTDHKVYAFYLKGRGYIPPVYGMFFLNYGTRDTIAPGQPYKFTIDVKINKNGLNEFNPNAYTK